jgi:CDP-diglyceride synthetase
MSIVEIHGRLGNTALLYVIILAVWALWRYFRRQGVDSNFWGALAIAEILLLVQGAFGAYIYFAGLSHLERQFMHFLYGIVGLIVIPAVFAYTRGDDQRRVNLVYGAALLFQMGIIMRAQFTS